MSPRGEEKKRLLVLELRDNATNPEMAVSLHITWDEVRAMLSVLYSRPPDTVPVSFQENNKVGI
jgi:hypothetical protein